MNRKSTLRTLGMAGLAAVLLAGTAMAQVKAGKTRPVTTKQLMSGLLKPQGAQLKEALEAKPADDKAWAAVATHAALINELSYVLMDDGRCPDGVWADAVTKSLRQGSADVLKAVEARDLEAAKAGMATMNKSCKACHEKHKE